MQTERASRGKHRKAATAAGVYVVRRGDSLSAIARAKDLPGGWQQPVPDQPGDDRVQPRADPPRAAPAPGLTRTPSVRPRPCRAGPHAGPGDRRRSADGEAGSPRPAPRSPRPPRPGPAAGRAAATRAPRPPSSAGPSSTTSTRPSGRLRAAPATPRRSRLAPGAVPEEDALHQAADQRPRGGPCVRSVTARRSASSTSVARRTETAGSASTEPISGSKLRSTNTSVDPVAGELGEVGADLVVRAGQRTPVGAARRRGSSPRPRQTMRTAAGSRPASPGGCRARRRRRSRCRSGPGRCC